MLSCFISQRYITLYYSFNQIYLGISEFPATSLISCIQLSFLLPLTKETCFLSFCSSLVVHCFLYASSHVLILVCIFYIVKISFHYIDFCSGFSWSHDCLYEVNCSNQLFFLNVHSGNTSFFYHCSSTVVSISPPPLPSATCAFGGALVPWVWWGGHRLLWVSSYLNYVRGSVCGASVAVPRLRHRYPSFSQTCTECVIILPRQWNPLQFMVFLVF